MKSLKAVLVISVIFAAMFISCRKSRFEETSTNASNHLSEKLTVENAESYQKTLEKKYGNYDLINISGNSEKNFKSVDFSHAYVGENATSFFVEAPISYTKRQILLGSSSGMAASSLKKMFLNSFDRFVVYKDKMSGMVSAKIITVIPSVDYWNNGHNDLYMNHYQSITKGFSGYVTSKTWKGQFLSSQSYNSGNVSYGGSNSVTTVQPGNRLKVNDISCNMETLYSAYIWCEDVDADGNGVNCVYVIFSYDAMVCDMTGVNAPTHSSILPSTNDPYWDGFPGSQIDPSYSCPVTPRDVESPVIFADIYANSTTCTVTFYDACFCLGYSWVIFEDMATGAEYSVPIDNQSFLRAGCSSLWATTFQIPANIPNGQYFIKVTLDGDTFYHQFEQNGSIIKRFMHTISR